jgi:hypothetical protein
MRHRHVPGAAIRVQGMTMPPAGPPPGYQGPQGPPQGPPQNRPAQGYPDQTVQIARPNQPGGAGNPPAGPAPAPKPKGAGAIALLGLVALVGVILGLSIAENGHTAWDSVNAWGGVAIAGALAVLAPALGRTVGLGPLRAWQVAVCGAGALVLFWVLFVLPSVGSNTSLLLTIGVAAGVIAAWIAPGRADGAIPPQQSR